MKARQVAGIVTLAGVLSSAPHLSAQSPASAHFVTWRPEPSTPGSLRAAIDSATPKANGSGMILGGITGMFIGFLGGALIGAAASGNGEDDLGVAVLGGLIAATITTPIGVHLGNHSQGRLEDDLLISAGIGVVGIALAVGTDEGGWLLMLPIGQIIGSTWTEVTSMPRGAAPDASH